MPKTANGKQLTTKQERFIAEFLTDFNASAAARRAGYSVKTADVIGKENLRKPPIQAALKESIQQRKKRVGVEADHVLAMLLREARRTGEGSSHAARVRAIELLAKHIGFFPADRVKLETDPKNPPRIVIQKEY